MQPNVIRMSIEGPMLLLNRDELYPSDRFMTFEAVTIVAQSILMPGSLVQKGTFFIASALTRKTIEHYVPPHSSQITSLLKVLPKDGMSRVVVSTVMIAGVSLTAYALCSLTSYSLVSGAIFSIHSLFLRDLSYAPKIAAVRNVEPDLISLRSLFETDQINFVIDRRAKEQNESNSEMISSVAFLVTSVGLTILCGNPIIANAIAYPAAATIKALALHVLTENTIRQQAQI